MASNDPILTTMRFIPKHEVVQKYGALLPDTLTNQAMKEEKTEQAPTASPGKRLKATAKVAKTGKKKLPTQGLETLSEIALSKAEQMKIVTKRSKTQFHSSHASGSGGDEGTGVSLGVPNVPTYGSDDEQISWKSSDVTPLFLHIAAEANLGYYFMETTIIIIENDPKETFVQKIRYHSFQIRVLQRQVPKSSYIQCE
ncbi:hypothetical protein Tco_0838802 [Tanacetum coccineum]|uniref:Uncharacterized protein n=1 Tax=Tanacetum coccineum TaxID=301880 RepID=A0ABQ5ANV8_9ASTR